MTYIIKQALIIICWIRLIAKNKFAEAGLDKNIKAFVAYISCLVAKIIIYLVRGAQILLL